MGAGSKDFGTSSNGKVSWNCVDMETDSDEDDYDFMDSSDLNELGQTFLRSFCRKASSAFFTRYGLISHQINSYNDFIKSGIQKVIDSIGEINVEPGYDPSKKGDGEWKHASLRFGKVTLERPEFFSQKPEGEGGGVHLKLLPRHARLQNMTYSARMKVTTRVKVYTKTMVRSDKFKTGQEQFLDKKIVKEDEKDVVVGRIPVMVKSKLCWMSEAEKGDCDFDHGGYFIIKGAEKVFIAQEQICLNRLWISNDPYWKVAYRSGAKRRRVLVKLVENPKAENITGGEKVLSVYLLMVEVPIWILFFALGVSSDKEVVDLIDCGIDDGRIQNILIASIHDADEKCEGFRRDGKALSYIDTLLKSAKFPPGESIMEFIDTNVFPSLSGARRKARYLGYMVKCLLWAFSGRRKCDNRDDFRNKRLDLAAELLERELWVHMRHAEKRMVKAIQRDLYGEGDLQSIEHYLDASIVTNGLSRAFSTGNWCHPFKRMERINGVVANLRRTNPLQSTCDLRKTRQQVSYTGKVGDARYPHPSHWGKLCFLSTPDGENCGLVKNLAITGLVSTTVTEPLLDKLLSYGMEKLVDDTCTTLSSKEKILLDGEWVGVCDDSISFVNELRRRRRRKQLPNLVLH